MVRTKVFIPKNKERQLFSQYIFELLISTNFGANSLSANFVSFFYVLLLSLNKKVLQSLNVQKKVWTYVHITFSEKRQTKTICLLINYPKRATMTRSWIVTVHNVRILKINTLKSFLVFKNGVKRIQTAGYNGAHTVDMA